MTSLTWCRSLMAVRLCYGLVVASSVGCASLSGLSGGSDADASHPDARGHVGLDAGSDVRLDAVSDSPRDAGLPPGAAVAISSGMALGVWCAVTASGDVLCWGDNERGGLGDGTTTSSTTPVTVIGLPGPAATVSVGNAAACAVTRAGDVYCWGYGADGALGGGTTPRFSSTPVAVSDLGVRVTSVSVGSDVACAVGQGGGVYCWGNGSGGMLGSASSGTTPIPLPIAGLGPATAVSVGEESACALVAGSVYCWGGLDGRGETGMNAPGGSATPVEIAGLPAGVTSVSVGAAFACAVTAAGGVMCWGDGTSGALGNNELAVSPTPVQVTGLTSGVREVAAGLEAVCALLGDGTVSCWGFGADGEIGCGQQPFITSSSGVEPVPTAVVGLSGVALSISAGAAPCAVTAGGGVECWGVTSEMAVSPVPVTGLSTGVVGVGAGGLYNESGFVCALTAAGSVECWGGNDVGQLGNGGNGDTNVPSPNVGLAGGTTGLGVASNGDFACAVNSGLALCWGSNDYGQLGNGTTTASAQAVTVQGLTGVTAVAAGAYTACALTAGGAVYCWGENGEGELGNNSTTGSLVPVAVPTLTSGVVALSLGNGFACALLSGGTVDCWGANQEGQLGDGTQTTRLVPTEVPGLTEVTALSAGTFSTCVVTMGTLKCWGENNVGILGTGTLDSSTSPVSVLHISSGATAVSVGTEDACAIVNGGAMCWGSAHSLGNGQSAEDFYFPVPVTGLQSGVTAVSVGELSACAVVNGGVQCWGHNFTGQLGNGGAPNALSATVVPGFP